MIKLVLPLVQVRVKDRSTGSRKQHFLVPHRAPATFGSEATADVFNSEGTPSRDLRPEASQGVTCEIHSSRQSEEAEDQPLQHLILVAAQGRPQRLRRRSAPILRRLPSNPNKLSARKPWPMANRLRKRQRTLICKHRTCRRRLGHSTEQCLVRKQSPAPKTHDDDTPRTNKRLQGIPASREGVFPWDEIPRGVDVKKVPLWNVPGDGIGVKQDEETSCVMSNWKGRRTSTSVIRQWTHSAPGCDMIGLFAGGCRQPPRASIPCAYPAVLHVHGKPALVLKTGVGKARHCPGNRDGSSDSAKFSGRSWVFRPRNRSFPDPQNGFPVFLCGGTLTPFGGHSFIGFIRIGLPSKQTWLRKRLSRDDTSWSSVEVLPSARDVRRYGGTRLSHQARWASR